MPDYSYYTTEELLLDDSFLNYCKDIPADTLFWESWIQAHPDKKTTVLDARKLYALLAVTVTSEDKAAAAEKLKLAIMANGNVPLTAVKPVPVYNLATAKRKWLIRLIAAAVTVFSILSLALWYNLHANKYNRPVADFTKANFKEFIKTGDGPRRHVELPDGSTAILNYGSVLKIAENYDKSVRWVYLEGEAFFSVKPDAEKPFVVITDKTATSALGTSFKVRSYPAEESGDVMLATGKVKVQAMTSQHNKPGDMTLVPGEKGTCDKNSSLVKSSFDPELLNNWRAMKIIFDKASLDNIIKTLEFYYGVQVQLQNKPAKEIAFTGKFFAKSLSEILEAISFTNQLKYTRTGNTVSILFQ